jgi:two-component system LytT family sensor kinase
MDRAVMNQSDIASDSVRALAEAAAQGQPAIYRSKGPARPILAGIGLDRPFFDDKNRAFWVLQSIGWSGYFILRSL